MHFLLWLESVLCRCLFYLFLYFPGLSCCSQGLGLRYDLGPGFGPKWSLTSEHAHRTGWLMADGRWSMAWYCMVWSLGPGATRSRTGKRSTQAPQPAQRIPHWKPRPQPLLALTMLPRVRSINMLRYQSNLSSYKQQRARLKFSFWPGPMAS